MKEMKYRMGHSHNGAPCSDLKIAGKLSLYWNRILSKIHLVLKQDAKLCIVDNNSWKEKKSETNKMLVKNKTSLMNRRHQWPQKKGTGLGENVFIIMCLFYVVNFEICD